MDDYTKLQDNDGKSLLSKHINKSLTFFLLFTTKKSFYQDLLIFKFFNSINFQMTKYYMQLLLCILMLVISHYLVVTDDQVQTIDVTELAPLVGVKVPNETVQISSWIKEFKELIVEALPNNEIHIRAADPNYRGEFDFHFLSERGYELTFSVDNYGHDLTRDDNVYETCQNQLESSLGDSCGQYAYKKSLLEWDVACDEPPSTSDRSARQNQNGFKLEHTKSDRWSIQRLDKEVRKRGFTYAILHVTFGPTGKEFCNFKVVMNTQNAEGGSNLNKGNRENTLLLPREDVPEEYREELFLDTATSSTPETPSTTLPASITTTPSTTLPASTSTVPTKEKERWTFPPVDKKVFEFMNN